MIETATEVQVRRILDRYQGDPAALVGILQDVQEAFGYLPQDALTEMSIQTGVPLSQLYSLATFYRAFSLKPRGKCPISLCQGTACHVRGGRLLLEKLERDLGIKAGETTTDGLFSLDTIYCAGACALAPLVLVGGQYHGRMNPVKLDRIVAKYRKGALDELVVEFR
jgi:NADH-quinone oxidoreductase subunit E